MLNIQTQFKIIDNTPSTIVKNISIVGKKPNISGKVGDISLAVIKKKKKTDKKKQKKGSIANFLFILSKKNSLNHIKSGIFVKVINKYNFGVSIKPEKKSLYSFLCSRIISPTLYKTTKKYPKLKTITTNVL